MANGHASNEPETTRTEPTRAERPASRREAVMADGLQAPSKTRETQTKLTRKKRNSRMTDAPGGEPGSVILANSFRSGRRCISESRGSATMARCPLPSPPLDVVLPPEREPCRTRAANATCCASYMRAEFNKFCLSLRARPVTRSCPAPAGPQDGTQGDGRKDRICGAPCGTPPLTRLPHPPRRREASPRRRGAWQAPPRRGDVLRK